MLPDALFLMGTSELDHCKSEQDFLNMGIQVFRPYDERIACSLATKCGPFMVQAFKLPHNGTPNYGFLITVDGQKILYMTDFEYCQYTFKNQKAHEQSRELPGGWVVPSLSSLPTHSYSLDRWLSY